MANKRLILHIGAPKCGSTALQTALSNAAEFGTPLGEQFRYAVIDLRGSVHFGPSVRRRAAGSPSQSASSANAKAIGKMSVVTRSALAFTLNRLLSKTSVILSAESWIQHARDFADADVLSKISAPIEAIAYVRPQVDFLNAAWWQWGAWSNKPFDQWMGPRHFAMCRWGELLEAWREAPNVKRVHVRLMADNVPGDFFNLIGCPPPENRIANRSLPGLALRFMQRHRHLRAGPHDSSMSFVLGRALEETSGGTPWVIPPELVERIVRSMTKNNHLLRAMLDHDSQQRMDADPRWWDASAYAGKQLESPDPIPARVEDAEQLAESLARRLMDAERELAALKARTIR